MLYRACAIVLFILGAGLTLINIYGLSQSLRAPELHLSESRFHNDASLSFNESLEQIKRKKNESDTDYAHRLTHVISQSLMHIHWEKETDTRKFNQLIPIWENYFIHLFSGLPEYKKYHFADYRRSLERGIGICGDASMIMSQLLSKENIPNQILAFPEHVVVSIYPETNEEMIFDPDFGIVLPFNPQNLKQTHSKTGTYYLDGGYSAREAVMMQTIYSGDFNRWNGVSHFIKKKYYFEKLAYFLKWPLPLLMIVLATVMYYRARYRLKSIKTKRD